MSTSPVRRAAVLGSPIAHSLSPALHNAAYTALGLTGWHYDRHEVDEAGLAGFVAGLGPEWAGLSLTMPLKRVLLDVADHVAPGAAAIGAGNTLVFEGTGATAHNTDVTGIARSLRACVRLDKLGERMITVDCDVIDADGGTRTASITGGFIALAMALDVLRHKGSIKPGILREEVAATGERVVD